jgi:hypothetical protein
MEQRGDVPQRFFGDHAPGRWAWLLRDVKPLNPPFEMKGRHGICGDHWHLIDKVRRQVYGRHLLRWRRYGAAAYGPAAARIWRGLVALAVECAAGIR